MVQSNKNREETIQTNIIEKAKHFLLLKTSLQLQFLKVL